MGKRGVAQRAGFVAGLGSGARAVAGASVHACQILENARARARARALVHWPYLEQPIVPCAPQTHVAVKRGRQQRVSDAWAEGGGRKGEGGSREEGGGARERGGGKGGGRMKKGTRFNGRRGEGGRGERKTK